MKASQFKRFRGQTRSIRPTQFIIALHSPVGSGKKYVQSVEYKFFSYCLVQTHKNPWTCEAITC